MERFRDDFRLVTVRRLDARHFIQEDDAPGIAEAIQDFLENGEGKGGEGG